MPLLQRAILVASVLATLLLLAIGAANATIRSRASVLDRERWTEEEFQSLIADQRRLASLGVFPTERGTRDAGEVLNPYVTLVGGREPFFPASEPAAWHGLSRAMECSEFSDQSWMDCVEATPAIDLSFLADLERFDAWDPSRSGAWAPYLRADPGASLEEAPGPNMLPFLNVAMLRLIEGLRGRDLPAALREVRQLARLTWAQGTKEAARVALAILRYEREAYEAAVQQGLLAAGDWAPLSAEDDAAARRTLYGMAAIYAGEGPPGALERLRAEVPAPLAQCAAADLAIHQGYAMRDLFTRSWPGELDLSPSFAALDAAIAEAGCPLTPALRAWQDPDQSFERTFSAMEAYLADDGSPPEILADADRLRFALRLPWIRQVAALTLLESASPRQNPYRDVHP